MKLDDLIDRLETLREEYGGDMAVGIDGQDYKEPITNVSIGYRMSWSNDSEWFVWDFANQDAESIVILIG